MPPAGGDGILLVENSVFVENFPARTPPLSGRAVEKMDGTGQTGRAKGPEKGEKPGFCRTAGERRGGPWFM